MAKITLCQQSIDSNCPDVAEHSQRIADIKFHHLNSVSFLALQFIPPTCDVTTISYQTTSTVVCIVYLNYKLNNPKLYTPPLVSLPCTVCPTNYCNYQANTTSSPKILPKIFIQLDGIVL